MKTKVLLLGAVVAAFALTSFAAQPLLSPRAKDAQNKFVKSSAETPTVTIVYAHTTSALLSPRAKENQIKVVNGVSTDFNAALACQKNMSGSPRAVAECSSHTTMPGCMAVASLK